MQDKTIKEYRQIVGGRIRQARIMAGFETIVSLAESFTDWGVSRLGNYENGTSMPNPVDIKRIAKTTDTSPCWIMFGIGSIRSESRDLQAVRHQNFSQLFEKLSSAEKISLRGKIKLKPKEVTNHLKNPFLKITASLCRKIEKHLGKNKGWMEEQHIDNDGLCHFFPDDIREVMTIYSDLDSSGRMILLETARTIQKHCVPK
ncbi:MAG: helix-turn-helix transcriptional regulator [Thiotrichaceae bacterium]|nr:helix-turn-helix transcriptional regulator [Thiotrichaceae bacterium]